MSGTTVSVAGAARPGTTRRPSARGPLPRPGRLSGDPSVAPAAPPPPVACLTTGLSEWPHPAPAVRRPPPLPAFLLLPRPPSVEQLLPSLHLHHRRPLLPPRPGVGGRYPWARWDRRRAGSSPRPLRPVPLPPRRTTESMGGGGETSLSAYFPTSPPVSSLRPLGPNDPTPPLPSYPPRSFSRGGGSRRS